MPISLQMFVSFTNTHLILKYLTHSSFLTIFPPLLRVCCPNRHDNDVVEYEEGSSGHNSKAQRLDLIKSRLITKVGALMFILRVRVGAYTTNYDSMSALVLKMISPLILIPPHIIESRKCFRFFNSPLF